MSIEYKPYMRQALVVGQRIGIEGTDWYCFEACSLLGVTLETNIPVIDVGYGAMLAQTQLSLEFKCASKPKQGRTRIENDILTTFKKIGVDQLVGEEIVAVDDGYASCVIITSDNEYVKLEVSGDYDDEKYLANEDLTLRDLLRLDLIADDVWGAHEREVETNRKDGTRQSNERNLKHAIDQVGGIEAAKKLMGLDNPV
jgi:hypothetical protein